MYIATIGMISGLSALAGALVGALAARQWLTADNFAAARREWAGKALREFRSFVQSWNEVSDFEWWHPLRPLPLLLEVERSAGFVDRWLNAHAVLLWADTKRILDQANGPIIEIPAAITKRQQEVESSLMKWARHGSTPSRAWFTKELTRMGPRIEELSAHDGSFYGFPGFVPTGGHTE